MDTWITRLQQRMKELGFTQEKLAEKMQVTRGAITHYLAGRRAPPLKHFHRLAKILKCDPAWLQFGVTAQIAKTAKPVKAIQRGIPLLDWNSVLKTVKQKNMRSDETELLDCFCQQKKNTRLFALRVKGDAMVAPAGHMQSFHEGNILIIDPDKEPVHGNYVIALLPNTKEATFKQYVIDSGTKYLKPLNPQYPLVKIEKNAVIGGTVIGCLWLSV